MAATRHVFLIVVDGLRPDALGRGCTPEIERLAGAGSACTTAQAVLPSISLPCHASMFCGMLPERHGVWSNTWTAVQPPVPSIVDVVHASGLRGGTASFYSWEELRDLWRPGSLDHGLFMRRTAPEDECDRALGAAAAAFFLRQRPALTFVYLGAADEVGHHHGWLSPSYLSAVASADASIAAIWRAVEASGCLAQTAFLVLADHGGHELDHSKGTAEDLTVPWIASGAGIRAGQSLAGPVSIVDTAPTLAHLLGVPRPVEWTGRVVAEALLP